VKITNTGNKTIDYMKFVATMDLQGVYHDVRVVKPLTNADGSTTLLARDGGTISFIVSFEKIDHTAKWEGNIPFARNVTLSEVRFR